MKILIGTDGSEFSHAAINKCCDLFANSDGVEFKVIAAMEATVPISTEPFAVSAEYYQRLINDVRGKARQDVDNATGLIRSHCPDSKIDIAGEVIEGPPAKVLIEAAKEWEADMIVVGAHGRGFWGRLLLGSVSSAVVHHAACSVLVVRHGDEK